MSTIEFGIMLILLFGLMLYGFSFLDRLDDEVAGVLLGPESLSVEKQGDATPFCFCPACHTYTGTARMIYTGQTLLERTCPRCTRKANREDTRRIALKPWQTITKTT